MKPRIGDITFNAANPPLLANFWASVMGYEVQEMSDDWADIVDPNGHSPRFIFQERSTPKTFPNRIHFDLYVEDMEGEVERIVGLGGRIVRVSESDGIWWTVMEDLEGNEFCVQSEI